MASGRAGHLPGDRMRDRCGRSGAGSLGRREVPADGLADQPRRRAGPRQALMKVQAAGGREREVGGGRSRSSSSDKPAAQRGYAHQFAGQQICSDNSSRTGRLTACRSVTWGFRRPVPVSDRVQAARNSERRIDRLAREPRRSVSVRGSSFGNPLREVVTPWSPRRDHRTKSSRPTRVKGH